MICSVCCSYFYGNGFLCRDCFIKFNGPSDTVEDIFPSDDHEEVVPVE